MHEIKRQYQQLLLLYLIIQKNNQIENSTKRNQCDSDKISANQWDVIFETTTGTNAKVREYVYALNELQMVTENGTDSYYYSDILGSTRFITSSTGEVLQETITDPFGRELLNAYKTEGTKYAYRFASHEDVNKNTGLTYMNARWMDNEVGRFISPDPMQQGINYYVYAQNNPTSMIDPTGKIGEFIGDWFDNYWFNNNNYNFGDWWNNNSNNFNFDWIGNYDFRINDYNISNNFVVNNFYDDYYNFSCTNNKINYDWGKFEQSYTEYSQRADFKFDINKTDNTYWYKSPLDFNSFNLVKYNFEHKDELPKIGSQPSLSIFKFNWSGKKVTGMDVYYSREYLDKVLDKERIPGDPKSGKLGDSLFILKNKDGKLVKVDFEYIACEFLSNINCINLAFKEAGSDFRLDLETCVRAFIEGQGKGEIDTIRYGSCVGNRQLFADKMIEAYNNKHKDEVQIPGRMIVNTYSNTDKYATIYNPKSDPFSIMENNNVSFNFALVRSNTKGTWGHTAVIYNSDLWYQIDSNTNSYNWYMNNINTVVTYEYDPKL